MSMENAILEHASALRELSAAVRSMTGGWSPVVLATESTQRIKGVMREAEQDPIDAKAAELAAATAQRAEAAIKAQQKDAAANGVRSVSGLTTSADKDAVGIEADALVHEIEEKTQALKNNKPDTELEAAVTKVEDDAKAAAPLDYAKDVKPVLLALVKAKQKPALVDLLAKYNAKNGEQIKADDFAAIVVDANALIAA